MRRTALLVVILLLLSAAPGSASLNEDLEKIGGQIGDLTARIESARAQRTAVGDKIVATNARMKQLIADLAQTEADLGAVSAGISEGEAQLAALRAELQLRYGQLDQMRRDLEAANERARAQAVAAYMGGGQDLASVFVMSEEVTDVALTVQYARRVSAEAELAANALEALRVGEAHEAEAVAVRETEVKAGVEKLRVQRDRLEELAGQVAARKADVEAELNVQRRLLEEVDSAIEEFDKELDALEAEQGRIKELIRQAQNPGGKAPGILVRPVPGPINSPFGNRVHPITGQVRLHTGVDFSAAYGQPIKAGAAGTVILAAFFGGYGNAVIIDHGGGMSTLYGHQSAMAVSLGDQVEAGQTIGSVGSTGFSTGPHLHFEVRLAGSPVDPAPYL